MPANQAQESVNCCLEMTSFDDNAMWTTAAASGAASTASAASPVSSLTQRLSDAGLHPQPTPPQPPTPKSALLSDTVRFGIDDSNDSLGLLFAGATPSAVNPGSNVGNNHVEDDDDEDDDVGEENLSSGASSSGGSLSGTPMRPRALTFCSSPSEPAAGSFSTGQSKAADKKRRTGLRRERRRQQPAPPRMSSAPFSLATSLSPTGKLASSSSTAAAAAATAAASSTTHLPPPSLPPPSRRRSFKRPSPTLVAAASDAVAAVADNTDDKDDAVFDSPHRASRRRQPTTPKRRRVADGSTPILTSKLAAKTPLGDASNIQQPQQQPMFKRPVLHRCTSELSALTTKYAVLNSDKVDNAIASIDSLNLIGNSEQQHSLPTVKELSYGIRYVSSATVSRLLRGDFAESVPSYTIIDCRYPYEFEGGHIQGAVNIFKQDELIANVMDPVDSASQARLDSDMADSASPLGASLDTNRPKVLIFHCEFSSERAPKLASYLRQKDRERNTACYPYLHFPEVYVLQGGYKSFFEAHKEDCQPCAYRRMKDPSFRAQLTACERDRKVWERQNSKSRHTKLQRLASCKEFR